MNLLKMADMQQIDAIIKRHKYGCENMSLQWPEKLCNEIWMVLEEKREDLETWRRTVERECKNLNKTWSDLKELAQSSC